MSVSDRPGQRTEPPALARSERAPARAAPRGSLLVIDSGNSRLKFGVRAQGDPTVGAWTHLGTLDARDVAALTRALGALPAPEQVVVANVAGSGTRASIAQALAQWSAPVHWVRASAAQCGVRNGYDAPERLGADRWVALIAAWHRRRAPTLVVNCGTATTIDRLDATGLFEGGTIQPGLDLMKRSLATNTAGLAMFEGAVEPLPRNTADAIESGCVGAQAGAIERAFRRMPAGSACLASGGAAERLAPYVDVPIEIVPHLTLEGLALVAAELP